MLVDSVVHVVPHKLQKNVTFLFFLQNCYILTTFKTKIMTAFHNLRKYIPMTFYYDRDSLLCKTSENICVCQVNTWHDILHILKKYIKCDFCMCIFYHIATCVAKLLIFWNDESSQYWINYKVRESENRKPENRKAQKLFKSKSINKSCILVWWREII